MGWLNELLVIERVCTWSPQQHPTNLFFLYFLNAGGNIGTKTKNYIMHTFAVPRAASELFFYFQNKTLFFFFSPGSLFYLMNAILIPKEIFIVLNPQGGGKKGAPRNLQIGPQEKAGGG